ncbi:MAG: 50S ribosomal protein L24 [Lachnospiraceae bacterium]|nr:50S ribosomal protein L24 [Lachnospiraceae bacterium]
MATSKIKKDDKVKVITGKYKDKVGKVLSVDHKNGKVVVEDVNVVTKHTKPSAANREGGIVKTEAPIDISNVMYLDKNGKVSRIGFTFDGVDKNGKPIKKRVVKTTGDIID